VNAADELTRLLAEWHRLTELEGRAILGEDWRGVARHQNSKARLCPPIRTAIQTLCASQAGEPSIPAPLGAAANDLIALEARNLEALRAKSQRKRAELDGASQTTRNLRDVRRAYGRSKGHGWQSYS